MMIKVEDIPESVVRPKHWQMWRVIAYRGKTGDIHLGQTFVRAGSETQACELGETALRMLGVRGRYVVNASVYYPWLDRELHGYVGFAS
jgi:hypothetical protein